MIGFLQGKVINQETGEPLGGVLLEFTGHDANITQNTGSNGEFTFEASVGSGYKLTATKTGFEQGIYEPLSVSQNPYEITIALQPDDIG